MLHEPCRGVSLSLGSREALGRLEVGQQHDLASLVQNLSVNGEEGLGSHREVFATNQPVAYE